MKNLLKTIAVLLFASTVTFANDSLTENNESDRSFKLGMYFDQSAGKIKTYYEKKVGETLKVTISNEDGQELARTIIGKKLDSARFNFDINELSDGTYFIQVSNGSEVLTKEVNVSTTKPVRELQFNSLASN